MGVTGHDQQTGAPRAFEFRGREFPVAPGFTNYQLGQISAYLKDKFPSPMHELKGILQDLGDAITAGERALLIKDARSRMEPIYDRSGRQTGGWPVTYNSHQGEEYMHLGPGFGKWLHVVLGRKSPDLTLAECEQMAVDFDADDLRRLFEVMEPALTNSSEAEKLAAAEGPDTDPDDEDLDPELEGYVDPKS